MKKYRFKIVEYGTCTCEKEVHVEANSLEEAEELVYNEEYNIDAPTIMRDALTLVYYEPKQN